MQTRKILTCVLSFALSTLVALAQEPLRNEGATTGNQTRTPQLSEYILGPGDEIVIMAIEAEEIANKPIRIGVGGEITLPMVGRVRASGMTVQELESEVSKRLKMYVREPQVSISVTQLRSQPVTVIGAVAKPGVVQLEGRKTLVEVLSLAGGTLPDASSRISITRTKEAGVLPAGSLTPEAASSHSVSEVDMRSIIDGSRPEQNIQILPHDLITVRRAPIVYAVGQFNKQGGFVLQEKEHTSVLQLIAMAGGIGSVAKPKDARIIRPVPGSTRIEVPVNLKDIMDGKAKDLLLQPDDILYVPDSYMKSTLRKTLDTTIQLTTGMIIYR